MRRQASQQTVQKNLVTSQYHQDFQEYSIEIGTHTLVARGRRRLEEMPGSMELLKGMLAFDPAKRITMYRALKSPLFKSMMVSEEECYGNNAAKAPHKFLAYFRPGTSLADI